MCRPRIRRLSAAAAALAALAAGAALVPAGAAPGAPPTTVAGLPAGVPPAALATEPVVPAPAGWPFGESFPRTSGTGRLAGGAAFWTDYLYDDHGAAGVQVQSNPASLAQSAGTYVYPAGPAANNGADIFRAAVGLTSDATWWRVDWNTLVDPKVPIAEWTFDTDANPATGGSAWPAGAGVSSPGIDTALVVSSRGARLLDVRTGRVRATFPTTVDRAARSFLVRVPRSVLAVGGHWRIRLAAGLAGPDGFSFAPVSAQDGAAPGQPAVYNVTFRSLRQEPVAYWMDKAQAAALAAGDVSAFSLVVDWAALAAKATTPEPAPTGYSNRWYVSPLNLGQGVDTSTMDDLRPNFFGRVQPYAVYVPTGYDPSRPAPLTWMLHSLDEQHNQYGVLAPRAIQLLCERRHSICATPLGFGPDGWYFDEAEVDFWDVWHDLATHYSLDPTRTVVSGYSMGGWGSYKLGLTYPDLFATAMPLAGPPVCGLRVYGPVWGAPASGRCQSDGDSTPLVANARWVPYILGDGTADELVPISGVVEQINAFLDAGLRIHAEIYPAEDHLVYGAQDGFSSEIAQVGLAQKVVDPGTIHYSWYPDAARADFGIGPTGVYWIRAIVGRDRAPGALATIDATSGMRPDPRITPVRSQSANVPGDPTPALVVQQSWRLGAAPAPTPQLSLRLTNVADLSVDLARAGFPAGQRVSLTVVTDGAVVVRLLHADGTVSSLSFGAGSHRLTLAA
ncbi:MAG TPA: alpha/beta hydrolase-fold protein [Acidimicrobiales bacterium]|nr:alpha/beta hydrolase-fold protein [Acidimicrobiales bacterium]